MIGVRLGCLGFDGARFVVAGGLSTSIMISPGVSLRIGCSAGRKTVCDFSATSCTGSLETFFIQT